VLARSERPPEAGATDGAVEETDGPVRTGPEQDRGERLAGVEDDLRRSRS
jgi:hypothetical protein